MPSEATPVSVSRVSLLDAVSCGWGWSGLVISPKWFICVGDCSGACRPFLLSVHRLHRRV